MKKICCAILPLFVVVLSSCQPKLDPLAVKNEALLTEQQKYSYALGANVGHIVQAKIATHQEYAIEYDYNLVVQGFVAAIQGQSQLDKNQIQQIRREIEQQVNDNKILLKSEQSEKNREAGIAFLAANAKRKGIVETQSGLQYEILKPGNGFKPQKSDTVKVHYRGTLLDGSEFDSSYARDAPLTIPLTRVIKGWTEGLQLMPVGAKYKFYIPAELAYGSRNTATIPSHATFIFEISFLEIVDTQNNRRYDTHRVGLDLSAAGCGVSPVNVVPVL